MKLQKKISNEHFSKINRQNEAIDIWVKNKGIGTFNHCPRFGKLYESCEIIKRYVNKNALGKVLIVVPSDIILKQWTETLYKIVGNYDVYFITLITNYKLASNPNEYLEQLPDLMIIDESHKFFNSDTLYSLLPKLAKIKFRLSLLGVLPDEKLTSRIEEFAPIIDVITEEEAIKNKWISDYTEFNVPLELRDADKIKYSQYTMHMKDLLTQFSGQHMNFKVGGESIFSSELELIIACYSGKKMLGKYVSSAKIRTVLCELNGWHPNLNINDVNEEKIDLQWNPMLLYDRCKTFKTIMDSRNEILNNNIVKLEAILKVIKKFKLTTIIFTESIEFVDTIVEHLNSMNINSIGYHSKIKSQPLIDPLTNDYYKVKSTGEVKKFGKTSIKKYAIENLENGNLTCIVAVKALDEGFTSETIEMVITAGGTTNPIQYSQRIARGNTKSIYKPNKITKVVNLFFDNFVLPDGSTAYSRDKSKLKQRQKYSKDVINLKKLEDLFDYY